MNNHAEALKLLKQAMALLKANDSIPAIEFQATHEEKLRQRCVDNEWPITTDNRVSTETAEKLLLVSEGYFRKIRNDGGPEPTYQSGAGARSITYRLTDLITWGMARPGMWNKLNLM